MSWRVAKSLLALRAQIDVISPNRSKASDGTIGDAAHASRSSDHNPWVKDGAVGVVTGMDITNDPAHGVDSEKLAQALRASKDPRIKYIISNRKIAASYATGGVGPWTWRAYTGTNPHNKHVHISVSEDKALYDSELPWNLGLAPTDEEKHAPETPSLPLLREAARGAAVTDLQRRLVKAGAMLKVDGEFGPKTRAAVMAFQRGKGLVPDGIVGPHTWEALGA